MTTLMVMLKPSKGSLHFKKKRHIIKKPICLPNMEEAVLLLKETFAHWLSGGIVPAVGLAGFSQTL